MEITQMKKIVQQAYACLMLMEGTEDAIKLAYWDKKFKEAITLLHKDKETAGVAKKDYFQA
ncbi:MAG: hypothetical protein J0I41_13225 [Filimonas sp.]|nr:hypothetical protein [Filimonas sp.]